MSINLQIQKAQKSPRNNDKKKNTPKYVIIKLIKNIFKEKDLGVNLFKG